MSSPFYYDRLLDLDHLTVKLISYEAGTNFNDPQNDNITGVNILRGFIKQDTNIAITNNWGTVDGIANRISKGLTNQSLSDLTSSILTQGNILTQLPFLKDYLPKIAEGDTVTEYLNSKFLSYSDYAKRYEGSTVSFPETIDIFMVSDRIGRNILEEIRSVLGIMVGGFKFPSDGDSSANEIASNFNVVLPPNQYEYDTNVFNNQTSKKGTLTLIIGNSQGDNSTKVILRNLIIKTASIEVSKNTTIENFPLYIKLSITLEPSVYYSGNDLDRTLGGSGDWSNVVNRGKVNMNNTITREE